VFSTVVRAEGQSEDLAVGRDSPFREELSTEAEEEPLLEAVNRKCLVKTLQAGKDIACAGVIGKVWKSMMAL
jgi:hypothetical protein